MSRFFIDAKGNYFEAVTDVEAPTGATVVPQRPSADHHWQNDAWGFVEPIVSTNPRDYRLTPAQWFHMVRLNELEAHLTDIRAQMKAGVDVSAYADLERTIRDSTSFGFDRTLEEMAAFSALLPAGSLPDEAALTPMWLAAKDT